MSTYRTASTRSTCDADWRAPGVPDQVRPWPETARFFFATAAFVALAAGSAGAADGVTAPPARTCAAAGWQGWYAGVNLGGVAYTAHRTDQDGQLGEVATYAQKQSGFFGGGQIGVNGTTCNALFGIEIDGSGGSVVASTTLLPNLPNSDISITSHFNGLVTARTRMGIVMDGLLFYVTGGVAGVHTITTYLNFNVAADTFTFSDWRLGWVAGFGAEWATSDRVSLRSEVLYVDTADRTFTFLSPTLGPGNFAHGDSMWIARVGINVKLGNASVTVSQ